MKMKITLHALIILIVHSRDTVANLIDIKDQINTIDTFDWVK